MAFKQTFDYGQVKNIPQIETSGHFADQLDTWMGIPYEMLEGMSVRNQRVIVKQRVSELIKKINSRNRAGQKSPTKPIETHVNTRLFLSQLNETQRVNSMGTSQNLASFETAIKSARQKCS